MGTRYTFDGEQIIKRKFKISIVANSYEEAEQIARELVEEDVDGSYYGRGDEDVEVEINEFNEEALSAKRTSFGFRNNSY